ncbi:hypothetical protein [Microbacterium sp. Marseille-Q6965]|uniref:hypothetical protein n=1 Tax=Microbacterium sp. Marseille-Q6965 TaxID=2965072 RepID=UPI0021B6FD29|nr:hypothetical protein [Microbacterium sp. Marseille-Q6965]
MSDRDAQHDGGTAGDIPPGDAAQIDEPDADRLAAAHGGTDFAGFDELTEDASAGAGERSATEEDALAAADLPLDQDLPDDQEDREAP